MSFGDEVVRLKDEEIEAIRFGLAYIRAVRMVNISEVERMVAGYLMIDHRRIKISDLEVLTGYSRKTIRTALVDLEIMGMANHVDGQGWRLTEAGMAILTLIYREASAIAKGKFGGYSEALLTALNDLPTKDVTRPFQLHID